MDMEDTLLNSAAAERNKKLGAENKIGHSIFFQQPVSYELYERSIFQ